MAFCSFSQDFIKSNSTSVQNAFLQNHLPLANGDAVKVYLYGLFLCEHYSEDFSINEFSEKLNMDAQTIEDCFKFWEEFGIVNVLSTDPFMVKYLPISTTSKHKKINAEKYSEFNKAMQLMIPKRMITTNEYSSYFSIMEDNNINPQTMLLIVKYCVDLKGEDIGFRYILKVVQDFVTRGITTTERVESELSDYMTRTGVLSSILSVLKSTKAPDVNDLNLFNKWTRDLEFTIDNIIYIAKKTKCKNMQKLDKTILELYSNKKFSEIEIEHYLKTKDNILQTAYKVTKALSLYIEVIDPMIDNYLSNWLNMGFDEETLVFLANLCFKKNKRTLDSLDATVKTLYDKGLISLISIADYINHTAKDDKFIKQILNNCSLIRNATEWDRSSLKTWRAWTFTDEMILKASCLANGKNNPIAYINSILSNWKTLNIFEPSKIPNEPINTNSSQREQRKYTATEINTLIDDVDNINF